MTNSTTHNREEKKCKNLKREVTELYLVKITNKNYQTSKEEDKGEKCKEEEMYNLETEYKFFAKISPSFNWKQLQLKKK